MESQTNRKSDDVEGPPAPRKTHKVLPFRQLRTEMVHVGVEGTSGVDFTIEQDVMSGKVHEITTSLPHLVSGRQWAVALGHLGAYLQLNY